MRTVLIVVMKETLVLKGNCHKITICCCFAEVDYSGCSLRISVVNKVSRVAQTKTKTLLFDRKIQKLFLYTTVT